MDLSQVPFENIPTDEAQQENGPEEYSSDFLQLSQLGYLSETVNWCGHKFVLKTLNTQEEIAAAKIVKNVEGTLAQFKTSLSAIVAASVVSINDMPFMPYMGHIPVDAWIQERWIHVTSWYWPTIEFLAEEHSKLAERAAEQVDELRKKFSGDIRTSSDLEETLRDRVSSMAKSGISED